jgi:hypothetical protein
MFIARDNIYADSVIPTNHTHQVSSPLLFYTQLTVNVETETLLWIRIDFNSDPDPDPAFYLDTDPDSDPGS